MENVTIVSQMNIPMYPEKCLAKHAMKAKLLLNPIQRVPFVQTAGISKIKFASRVNVVGFQVEATCDCAASPLGLDTLEMLPYLTQ